MSYIPHLSHVPKLLVLGLGSLDLPVHGNVQVALGILVLLEGDLARNDSSLLQSLIVLFGGVDHQDTAAPVGLGAKGAGGEEDGLVVVALWGLDAAEHAGGDLILAGLEEESVEPGAEAIEVIDVLVESEADVGGEVEVGDCDGVKIEDLEGELVC